MIKDIFLPTKYIPHKVGILEICLIVSFTELTLHSSPASIARKIEGQTNMTK